MQTLKDRIAQKASNFSFKITFYFFLITIILWVVNLYVSTSFGNILPAVWANIIEKLSNMITLFINSLLVFVLIYKNQVKRLNLEFTYESIFTNNPNAILVINPINFSIKNCNNAAIKMFEFSEKEFLNNRLIDLVYSKEKASFKEEFLSYSQDTFSLFQKRLVSQNGIDIYCNINFSTFDHQEESYLIASFTDISNITVLKYRYDTLKIKIKQLRLNLQNLKQHDLEKALNELRELKSDLISKNESDKIISDLEYKLKHAEEEIELLCDNIIIEENL